MHPKFDGKRLTILKRYMASDIYGYASRHIGLVRFVMTIS